MDKHTSFFISTEEFSKRTGLKENEVRKLIFQKNFPQFRIVQGRFYIDAFNASAYLQANDKEYFISSMPFLEKSDELIPLPQLCKQMGISAKKMTLLLRRSDFPKLKIGARYYFHLSNVYGWFLEQLGTIIFCGNWTVFLFLAKSQHFKYTFLPYQKQYCGKEQSTFLFTDNVNYHLWMEE